MEILITLIIVSLAVYILFKTFYKSNKNGCSCGNCSDHCPMYKNKSTPLKIDKSKKK